MKKYVRILTTEHYYVLSERYSFDEIFNKVIDANDHTMLKLYNWKDEPRYIRASMIEAIDTVDPEDF